MTATQQSSGFSIGVVAFVIAIGVTVAYYQFSYLPEISKKPVISQEILEPEEVEVIKIIKGSADPSQPDNFVPRIVEAELGLSNRVQWVNEDASPHTVTTDEEAVDKYSGIFDSREITETGFVVPGETFEFLFTQEGEFAYHCEPHPWMKGIVKVIKQKF